LSRNEDIKKLTNIVSGIPSIRGCITGSSQIGADYDTWEECPDIDLFVYTENMLSYAADALIMLHGFQPATKGEEWKLSRIRNRGMARNMTLSTLKLKHPDYEPLVNVTWKEKRDNLFAVLASFDMSIVMVGLDIPSGTKLDLRTGSGFVLNDPKGVWSPSKNVAVPNPLREQNVDMYGAEMWIRQFSRCIKYWNRGYDTRPMAMFYIRLIDQVIEDGQLFTTKNSEERYNDFKAEFEPLKEQMVKWLEDKEDC